MSTSESAVLLRRSPRTELALVVLGFGAVAILLTYPLAFQLGTVSYKIHAVGDAQYSVWNVAWVAHALLTDPSSVFHANIFYPHQGTLLYSEANLLAGALAVPVYWVTGGNAYAAHNSVVLLSFVLSATGTYYLARYLVGDRRAALVAAVCFAYCPYVFSRLAHIQLLMTAGIPFSLLAFHRIADRPTAGRGVVLGLTMGLQGLACGYYAVFLAVLLGPMALLTAGSQRLWRHRGYWSALALAAFVAGIVVLPLFAGYLALQRDTGFARTLADARMFSATWRSYLTSGAYASSWLQNPRDGGGVLFPGFIAGLGGIAGLCVAWRAGGRPRRIALLYGSLALMALWLSLGPAGGLYTIAYVISPVFTFTRDPSRFGIVVSLSLSVLAGIAVAALLRRVAAPALLVAALSLVAVAEHVSPLAFTEGPPVDPVYHVLAEQPFGAVLELPLYSRLHAFSRTRYMLASTVHWKPIVNGYSDYIPLDFSLNLPILADFPTEAAFEKLPAGVRYAVFFLDAYPGASLDSLIARLEEFASFLRLIYEDERAWLYEIVGAPGYAPAESSQDDPPPSRSS